MCSDLIWKGYDKADTLTFSAFVLVNCQVECTTDGETRVLQENIRRYSKKTSDDTLRQCPMIENILLAPLPQKHTQRWDKEIFIMLWLLCLLCTVTMGSVLQQLISWAEGFSTVFTGEGEAVDVMFSFDVLNDGLHVAFHSTHLAKIWMIRYDVIR